MADSTPAVPPAASEAGHTAPDDGFSVHVVSAPVLLAVFASLIVLTYATVAATQFNLGDWNLVIAMAIATVKAALVALYFMHLRYDKSFYTVIFLAALLFVGLFIAGTLLDTIEYQPDTDPWADAVSVAK
jgi:cytochrome c oxidase subunit 4